jgi:uncharacterized protein
MRPRHRPLSALGPGRHVDPKTLPTPGEILAAMSNERVGGAEYDRSWSERARQTMW